MADAHDRSAQVLDPTYLDGLEGSTRRRAPRQARRVRGARDRGVVRPPPHAGAHRHPRGRDQPARERRVARGPHRSLPADPVRPGSAREPGVEPAAAADGTRAGQRVGARARAFDGVLTNLPTLSDAELDEAITGLRALEREVSDQRRALFAVIDRIDRRWPPSCVELVARSPRSAARRGKAPGARRR